MGNAGGLLLDKMRLRNTHETIVKVHSIQVLVYDQHSNAFGASTSIQDVLTQGRLLVHLEDRHPPKTCKRPGAIVAKVRSAVSRSHCSDLSCDAAGEWSVGDAGRSATWRAKKPAGGLHIRLKPRRGDETTRSVVLQFEVAHPQLPQPQARARIAVALPQVRQRGSREVVTEDRREEGVGDDLKVTVAFALTRQPGTRH